MDNTELAMQAIRLYADTHSIKQIDSGHFNHLLEHGYVFLDIVMKHINCTIPQLRKCINTTESIHIDNLTTRLGLECLRIAIKINGFDYE